MTHLKRWLLRWLGIDRLITSAVDAERERHATAITGLAAEVDDVTGKLAGALRTVVGQLNHNTTVVQRWASESESLRHIEERHARKAKSGLELVNGNGSRIITPGSAS